MVDSRSRSTCGCGVGSTSQPPKLASCSLQSAPFIDRPCVAGLVAADAIHRMPMARTTGPATSRCAPGRTSVKRPGRNLNGCLAPDPDGPLRKYFDETHSSFGGVGRESGQI